MVCYNFSVYLCGSIIYRKFYLFQEGLFTMKLTVCIGSSCHIKGSRQVVEQLQRLINENNVADKVTLSGAFCMGKCQQGVCVTFNDNFYSVTPANVEAFFKNEVMAKV